MITGKLLSVMITVIKMMMSMMMMTMMTTMMIVMFVPSNSGWWKGVHSTDQFGFVPSLEKMF